MTFPVNLEARMVALSVGTITNEPQNPPSRLVSGVPDGSAYPLARWFRGCAALPRISVSVGFRGATRFRLSADPLVVKFGPPFPTALTDCYEDQRRMKGEGGAMQPVSAGTEVQVSSPDDAIVTTQPAY